MNLGTCIHFTGLPITANHQQCCKAGVNYLETFNGKEAGIFLRMPCVEFREKPAHGKGTYVKAGEATIREPIDRKGHEAIPCPHRQEPTQEQVDEDRRQRDAHFAKTIAALKVAGAWKVKKPEADRREVVECPVCKGRLHLYQSALNGHCHGKCETDGCVSWME